MDAIFYKRIATRYKVRFDGMQAVPNGEPVPMFTHSVFGTFVLEKNETMIQALLRKQNQWFPSTTPPGPEIQQSETF